MPLPTLDKTWQFNVNQAATGGTTQLLAVKNALIGFASSPWTVWGSCDAVNFGNGDGVDRWDTPAKIVSGTGVNPRSWIVLEQAGLGPKSALRIECSGTSISFIGMLFSAENGYGVVNGGTDGTLTSSPGSLSQANVAAFNNAWGGAIGAQRIHVMQSTDGACTRVALFYLGNCTGWWQFDKAKDPTGSFKHVLALSGSQISSENATYSQLSSPTAGTYSSNYAGGNLRGGIAWEGINGVAMSIAVMNLADEDTGEWPFFPLWLLGHSHLTFYTNDRRKGLVGKIHDLWVGANSRLTGDYYPNDGSKQFAHIYNLIVPWDGSTMLTS